MRSCLFLEMCCWSVKRCTCWAERCLPWTAASCLPMPRKNGAALFPSSIRKSRRLRPRWRSCWKSRCKPTEAKMIPSHGAVQGYNSQALIDAKHQVIVHGEAFGDGQDHGHIPPMLTGALANLQSFGHEPDYFQGKIFTADSN